MGLPAARTVDARVTGRCTLHRKLIPQWRGHHLSDFVSVCEVIARCAYSEILLSHSTACYDFAGGHDARQLDLGWKLGRQIARLGALQNPST